MRTSRLARAGSLAAALAFAGASLIAVGTAKAASPTYQGNTTTAPAQAAPPTQPRGAAPSVLTNQRTGVGVLGASPSYPGGNVVATPTGAMSGSGTGVGIGNTELAQPSSQTPVASPDGPSTTPGGPPTVGTGSGGGR